MNEDQHAHLASAGASPRSGDSLEQRAAEGYVLAAVQAHVGVQLAKEEFRTESGERVEIDAASEDPPLLVEAWAHQGRPKSAQRHKVLADAFKLLWVQRGFRPGARMILAFADEEAARPFRSGSWMATALRDLRVDTVVVSLPEDVREAVLAAQRRQYR
jgi:hypothetical protein